MSWLSAKSVPLVGIDVGLTQNAAERANRNLGFLRHDSGVDSLLWSPPLLAGFDESTASSRRLTSRKGCGLSRPNLNLDRANLWGSRGLRRLEVQLQCFL